MSDQASNVKDKMSDQASKLKDKMSDQASNVKDKMGDQASILKDKISDLASNVKDKMGDQANKASQSMGNQMHNAQNTGGKMANDFKSNVEQAGSQMDYWKTQYEESKDMPIDKLILCDHTAVRTIYDKFKNEKNKVEAEKWRNQLIYEIARHSIAEELVVYPLIRSKLQDGEKIFQKDIQEQHRIKEILYEAQSIDKDSPDFRTKIDEAMQLLFKHIESEESEQLPLLRKCLSEEESIKYGNQYMRRKFIVPTKPHTAVPEDPPTLNSILGLLTAPLDKFRDLFTAFPDQSEMADIKKQATEHVHTHDKSGSCCDENKH
jgi:hemerythrin superfamily protein